MDSKAMFKIGYGLYVLTAREGGRDNGCVVNTFQQVTGEPPRVSVTVSKANHTCGMIARTGAFNVSVIAESATFDLFKRFGFQSGRDADKFAGFPSPRCANGILAVDRGTNAVISARVVETVDLGTHLMFIADVTDAVVRTDEETATYSRYHKSIKPKPQAAARRGWRCVICGYLYEGETLPPDFVCPLCKHPASDFERVGESPDGNLKSPQEKARTMSITKDIVHLGVNDHQVDLFEGQYPVPNGMAYNSYAVIDEKVTVFDTMEGHFGEEWFANIRAALGARTPDYLVVQHMEPDHSANIAAFMAAYPQATLVSSAPAFAMMRNFFGTDFADRRLVVKDGDTLATGRHTFAFVAAPMVHWPEVIVTYDATDKVLFSADGFGKFGANDVVDPEGWDCEARRYYIGIVGKYGQQVQALLRKAAGLEIGTICPLHGPVLSTPEEVAHAVAQYQTWSSYAVESEGVLIAYTSVYGHTKAAVEKLADLLKARGCPKVVVADLARDEMFETVEDAFRYGKIVLATTTYNAEIFPFMRTFISHLTERNYQNRTIGLIENGSWAPTAARVMRGLFEKSRNIRFCETVVTVRSALSAESDARLAALADELVG